jgi:hypothetical protein
MPHNPNCTRLGCAESKAARFLTIFPEQTVFRDGTAEPVNKPLGNILLSTGTKKVMGKYDLGNR